MSVRRRFGLGALAERDFRLLFTATAITTIGDRLAVIALAFAVLDLGGATDLGIVLAARQGVNALVFLAGGVISDRVQRNLVLVGASLVQGAAQAVTAALVLSGHGSVLWIAVLQAVYGVGDGLVVPAETGLVPQTVSPARLQQANVLQGLTRNVTRVLGPIVGAAIVVAASPGAALAADAVSFVLCALILLRIRIAPRVGGPERETFWRELRAGWREFTARTWLWSAVLLYGLGNFTWGAWSVLGPVVAKHDLGGAGPWGAILAAAGVGSVAGGVVALQFVALAAAAPVAVIAAASFVAGVGLAVHLALWFTVFQQQVPEHAQSRVSSYDALGSFVLLPIGAAIVGPVAAAVGVHATLWGAGAFNLACCLGVLALPSVWGIREAPAAV